MQISCIGLAAPVRTLIVTLLVLIGTGQSPVFRSVKTWWVSRQSGLLTVMALLGEIRSRAVRSRVRRALPATKIRLGRYRMVWVRARQVVTVHCSGLQFTGLAVQLS